MIQNLTALINPQYLIIIGSIITLIGTYLSYVKGQLDSNKLENKVNDNYKLTEQVHSLSNKIENSQNELKDKQKQIENLQNKNYELSQSISTNALEIINYVSSKNSYAYIVDDGILNNVITNLSLIGIGEHPLKINNIRIFDLNLNKDIYYANIERTVYPDWGLGIKVNFPTNISEPTNWNIFFETSNGHLVEEYRRKYKDSRRLSSIKIFDMDNTQKILYQKIDDGFEEL